MRTPRILVAAVAATSMAVAGCSPTTSGGVGDDAPEVAATVGDVEIPSSRISEVVDLQAAAVEGTGSEEPERRLDAARQALSAEIQLQAVESAVEERFGLDISDEAVDEALAEQIEAQGGEERFEQLASESGLSAEEARQFARDNAYVTVLVEYVQEKLAEENGVTDDDLRAQYEEDPTQYQSAEVRHILVETEEEAQAVLERLEGGEDFSEVAMDVSTDPGSAQNGGSLGEAPRGSYVPAFSDAVYSEDTEIGEVVGPVETQFGFHLILVDSRTSPEFEEVRDQIESQIVGGQFEEFLQTVFAEAEIEVDPYYGRWDANQRMVVPVAAEDTGTDAGTAAEGGTGADAGDATDGAAETGTDEG